MIRREFIALLGGGVVGWPLATPAQQAGKIYRIGFLANDPTIPTQPAGQAFLDGLRENGFVEGKNIIIESRSALAGSVTQPGETVGLNAGAPLPPGWYAINTVDWGCRNTTPTHTCTGGRPRCVDRKKSWPHFPPSAVDFCGSRLAIGAATERARALVMPAGTRAQALQTRL